MMSGDGIFMNKLLRGSRLCDAHVYSAAARRAGKAVRWLSRSFVIHAGPTRSCKGANCRAPSLPLYSLIVLIRNSKVPQRTNAPSANLNPKILLCAQFS